jgi:hypothetical protein
MLSYNFNINITEPASFAKETAASAQSPDPLPQFAEVSPRNQFA